MSEDESTASRQRWVNFDGFSANFSTVLESSNSVQFNALLMPSKQLFQWLKSHTSSHRHFLDKKTNSFPNQGGVFQQYWASCRCTLCDSLLGSKDDYGWEYLCLYFIIITVVERNSENKLVFECMTDLLWRETHLALTVDKFLK